MTPEEVKTVANAYAVQMKHHYEAEGYKFTGSTRVRRAHKEGIERGLAACDHQWQAKIQELVQKWEKENHTRTYFTGYAEEEITEPCPVATQFIAALKSLLP